LFRHVKPQAFAGRRRRVVVDGGRIGRELDEPRD